MADVWQRDELSRCEMPWSVEEPNCALMAITLVAACACAEPGRLH
jgi:hypothetical protein